MSLHVYLEGLRPTSSVTESKSGNASSVTHVAHEALGNETVQISIATISLKSFTMLRGTWLIQEEQQNSREGPTLTFSITDFSFCFSYGFLEDSEPAHPGGYGCWCLPRRYKKTDSSLYSKRTLGIRKQI